MARQRRPYMAARTPSAKKAEETFEAPRRKLGRPSYYTPELGFQICERMVEGESVQTICLDPDMPSRTTIYYWLTQHAEFRERYKVALELYVDYLADLAQAIADGRSADFIEKDGKLIPDWELVQRSRLRVDTIKWKCAKLHPSKDSDRYQISGANEKPKALQQIALTDDERVKALGRQLDRIENGDQPPLAD
jgi:hypothetical protein